MKKDQMKRIQKNFPNVNPLQNSGIFNLEEVNKAIELTQFNVRNQKIIFQNRKLMPKMPLISMLIL